MNFIKKTALHIKHERFNDYPFLFYEGKNLPKNYWQDLDLDEPTQRIVQNEGLMKIFIFRLRTDSFKDNNKSNLEEYNWRKAAGSPTYLD